MSINDIYYTHGRKPEKFIVKEVIHMKNTLKKIASIAMAFTLLGAGTAITKNVSPKSDNTITASAACQYHDGSYANGRYITNYRLDTSNYSYYKSGGKWYKQTARYCRCCGSFTGWFTERA